MQKNVCSLEDMIRNNLMLGSFANRCTRVSKSRGRGSFEFFQNQGIGNVAKKNNKCTYTLCVSFHFLFANLWNIFSVEKGVLFLTPFHILCTSLYIHESGQKSRGKVGVNKYFQGEGVKLFLKIYYQICGSFQANISRVGVESYTASPP